MERNEGIQYVRVEWLGHLVKALASLRRARDWCIGGIYLGMLMISQDACGKIYREVFASDVDCRANRENNWRHDDYIKKSTYKVAASVLSHGQ